MTLSPDNKKIVCIADKKHLPKPLSEIALRQFIKKALSKDWIREGWHSEVERSSRNVSHDDIICGLERSDWKLVGTRESPQYGEHPHSYEILTKDVDDVELELVVAPNLKTGTLKVVTKY